MNLITKYNPMYTPSMICGFACPKKLDKCLMI